MHDFWLLASRIYVSIWIDYVATKANLADPPSRLPFPRCVEAWPDEDISVLAPQASLVALVLPPPAVPTLTPPILACRDPAL